MCKTKEALDAIKAMEDTMITVTQAAEVLGCDPQTIRLQAREDQSALGFHLVRLGSRTMIPRLAFIKFIEGT